MTRTTSVYLDALRFAAALMVFLSHISYRSLSGGFLWPLQPLGWPAVVVFFVMSGFVIGYVAEEKERTLRDYAIARAARIYSVAVPALVLTAALDWIGLHLRPEVYPPVQPILGAGLPYLPLNLTFLNMAWWAGPGVSAGSNVPYWSLGYEVPYYVLFGIAFYCSGRTRLTGFLAVCLLTGPAVLSLFPLWLLGFGCFHACRRNVVPARTGALLFVLSAALAAGYAALAVTGRTAPINAQPALGLARDYALAIIFAAGLVGFNAIPPTALPFIAIIERPVRWLAGATFTLYLLHYPLMYCIRALLPWPSDSWQVHASLLLGTLGGVFVVAAFTERRKGPWRRLFEAWVPSGPASGSASGPARAVGRGPTA